jgi:hypothetical protein
LPRSPAAGLPAQEGPSCPPWPPCLRRLGRSARGWANSPRSPSRPPLGPCLPRLAKRRRRWPRGPGPSRHCHRSTGWLPKVGRAAKRRERRGRRGQRRRVAGVLRVVRHDRRQAAGPAQWQTSTSLPRTKRAALLSQGGRLPPVGHGLRMFPLVTERLTGQGRIHYRRFSRYNGFMSSNHSGNCLFLPKRGKPWPNSHLGSMSDRTL